MNWHVLERATTQTLIAFVGAGTGIAAVAAEANERQVMPWEVILILGGFLVMFAGALALAFVRWLNKAGANVPRDPQRITAQIEGLQRSIEALRLEAAGDRANIAFIQGQLSQLAIVVPEDRRHG